MATILSLTDAKDFLRLRGTSTADDDRLQDFLVAAQAVAEFYVGDIVGGTYTETHDGGDAAIYTRHTPIQTVTSLTEYVGSITYTLTNQPLGHSVDAWGYTIDDPEAGRIVRRSASGMAWRFVPGSGNVTITYTTGRAAIPGQVITAVEFIVQHLWTTQRGAMPMNANPGDGESMVPGIGYAIPNRAIELLETVPRMPVFG